MNATLGTMFITIVIVGDRCHSSDKSCAVFPLPSDQVATAYLLRLSLCLQKLQINVFCVNSFATQQKSCPLDYSSLILVNTASSSYFQVVQRCQGNPDRYWPNGSSKWLKLWKCTFPCELNNNEVISCDKFCHISFITISHCRSSSYSKEMLSSLLGLQSSFTSH